MGSKQQFKHCEALTLESEVEKHVLPKSFTYSLVKAYYLHSQSQSSVAGLVF